MAVPHPYPVSLDLRGRRCVVVGGGPVAAAKARGLLDAGAEVLVVAADGDVDLPGVAVARRPFDAADLDGAWLVIAASGDAADHERVHAAAETAGVWVNAADDPAHCTFTLPAVVRRGPVTVAVATGGASPALASWLRRRLDEELGPEIELLAGLLASEREALRSSGVSTEGLPWQAVLDAGALNLVREGRVDEARELIRTVGLERGEWD